MENKKTDLGLRVSEEKPFNKLSYFLYKINYWLRRRKSIKAISKKDPFIYK